MARSAAKNTALRLLRDVHLGPDDVEAKHDVSEAKHDVIKAKHDVICLLQFAKSFLPPLRRSRRRRGGRRRRPSYAHGGLVMRPESGRDAP